MGWFEKFSLFSLVIGLVSVSVLLVALVQLTHRLEDGVNRDNSELLKRIGALRASSELHGSAEQNHGPLVAMIIRSSRQNSALRRTIRRTWAREDRRVMHRFVLHAGNISSKSRPITVDRLAGWLKRLQHHGTVATNARYVLFANESVFVNTPLLLAAIERVLPKEAFILCTPGTGNVTCDAAHPILVSMDIVRGRAQRHVVHDGRRLYLNRRETEALVRHQLDDELGLTYFFTASLYRLSVKRSLPTLIDQLWLACGGNDTPVEY
uniref:Hexosyltransferase n=1 Tax=Anopheles culicifacies TaxID=139723 RepID=A0A182LRD9_9DIPT